ncbi:hypothetical protein BC830DRAFT_1051490, partial [Chytriomyces sp. MP71]
FFAHIDLELHLKRMQFYEYQKYHKFLTHFQWFKEVFVKFTSLCHKIKEIKLWFKSNECKLLPVLNTYLSDYWKAVPEE